MKVKLRINAPKSITYLVKGSETAAPVDYRGRAYMRSPKTSTSHPLRIDSVAAGKAGGLIGLTFCPGKKQTDAHSGTWERNFEDDMKAIKAFGAKALVTLMPNRELESLGVTGDQFRDNASQLDVEWFQLPVPDAGVPDQRFEDLWINAGSRLRALLRDGHNIVVHCKGGLGRTGTIAARLLIELGADAKSAIKSVRKARPGAIENSLQESYILGLKPERR